MDVAAGPWALEGDITVGARNVCMMHALERLAREFNRRCVPVMALKGAALNLVLDHRPDERAMSDVDLLIRPQDADRAAQIIRSCGGEAAEPLVRDDFFPRFHAEREFRLGAVYPIKIDLHVRPFRPVRFAQTVPSAAMWDRAEWKPFGSAWLLVPGREDMLIHLATHSALHGNVRRTWLNDIRRWIDAHRGRIDWELFCARTKLWGLTWPVLEGLRAVDAEWGCPWPREVVGRLANQRVSWRDKLAAVQAPRDATHPVAHVLTNWVCAPSWRFAMAYLWAVAVPGRRHMAAWYGREHVGWLPCAHLLRVLWPVLGRLPGLRNRASKYDLKTNRQGVTRVFARRDIRSGETIARCRGRAVERLSAAPAWRQTGGGQARWYEVTGALSHLRASPRPNAKLAGSELIALRPIRVREEITIGKEACDHAGEAAEDARGRRSEAHAMSAA